MWNNNLEHNTMRWKLLSSWREEDRLVVSSHDCRNTYRWSVDTIREPSSVGFIFIQRSTGLLGHFLLYNFSNHWTRWLIISVHNQRQQVLQWLPACLPTCPRWWCRRRCGWAVGWLSYDTCSMNTKSVSVQNASDKKLNPYQMSITYELLKAIQIKRTSV